MEEIPEEIVLNIIGFLDMSSFLSITLTCKLFHRLCNDQRVLVRMIYNTYPWLNCDVKTDLELNPKTCYQQITTLYKKVQNEFSEPIPTTTIYNHPKINYPNLNREYFVKNRIPFGVELGEEDWGCLNVIFVEECLCHLGQDGLYTITIFPNIDQSYGPFSREEATVFLQNNEYKKANDYSALTLDDYQFGREIGLLFN